MINKAIMKILKESNSIGLLFYVAVFVMTQITGLLLSLVICFILNDFTTGFVRVALENSFILGLSLIGSCYLTKKMMLRFNIFYTTVISFSLVLGVSLISFLVVFFSEPSVFIYYDRGAFAFIAVNFLFITALHVISSGLIIHREIMVQKEKAIGNERDLKNQMEMKLLSSRINPHFLFNTLNMILNLLKYPEKAECAILNLSDLLRENLEQSGKSSIPVSQEIDNIRKFLEIQKLRFGERLDYAITGQSSFYIPPLIIQPLVENCIKHNMQNVSSLTILVSISGTDSRISIKVIDSVKAVNDSMLDKGQGLTITKKRVENSKGAFLFKDGGIEIVFGL